MNTWQLDIGEKTSELMIVIMFILIMMALVLKFENVEQIVKKNTK